jgi:tetratricopeptide (TPR) repeat protein
MPRRVDAVGAVFLLSYAVLILLSAAVVALRRNYPGVLAAWIAFVIVTLPMLGVVQNGPQIAADRYTYHAGLALAIPAAAAFAWLDAKRRSLARFMGAATLVMLGALSWQQVHVWRDSRSFWAYTFQREPGSALAGVSLANEIVGTNLPDALALYDAAVRIDPTYPVGENDYAVALRRAGRLDDAVAHFRRAVQLQPSYADAHSNLGSALSAQGKTDDAIAEFERALALDPDLADAQFNWANALFKRGDLAGAITHYQLSLRLRPGDPDAASNLATAQELLRASEHRAR